MADKADSDKFDWGDLSTVVQIVKTGAFSPKQAATVLDTLAEVASEYLREKAVELRQKESIDEEE